MKNTTFAKRLTQALKIRGITAAEFSRRMGISEAVISQYRSGKYEPKQDRLDEFAKALDVSEGWLMGYDVPMERQPLEQEKPADNVDEPIPAHVVEFIDMIEDLTPDQLVMLRAWLKAMKDER